MVDAGRALDLVPVPALTLDLDAYRRDGEAFLSALDEAHYLHYAGHTPDLSVAPLYERFGHLFSPEAAADLRAAAADARGDAGRSLRALAEFAVDGCLSQAVRAETEALARRETDATVRVEGETFGYREIPARMANEPDRTRRAALEAARLRVVGDELTPILAESWATQHALARDLGAGSYAQLFEGLRGIDLAALAAQGRALLDDTAALYERAMDGALRSAAGIGIEGARRSDLPPLFRATAFDPHFPSEHMLPALERTLEGLGIELRRQSNVVLDTERRAGKDPRAFCAPVRVPDRVYLVVSPIGGVDDFRALFHEAGHTEHYANTGSRLPFEFRYLGDNSVTEAYAFLLEGLTADPAWLTSVLGYREHGDFLRHTSVVRLYYHRRYAAKIAYELRLHSGADAEGADVAYADLLSDATRLPWPSETYLADVDQAFYVASYLRAWALEVSLREHLRERFGSRWFAQRAAGGLLRELWYEGQRLTGDELAAELGLPPIDLSVLSAEAAATLG
jgi:hypothetical protein